MPDDGSEHSGDELGHDFSFEWGSISMHVSHAKTLITSVTKVFELRQVSDAVDVADVIECACDVTKRFTHKL